ncbi:MAG: C4-dicarboxylate ABC transporter substrate-binding protein [Pseudomonadota bacterium]
MMQSIHGVTRGLAVALLSGAATVANAQDITLQSPDGTINLTGKLLQFSGLEYVIESEYGPLRVAVDHVTCTGDACPTLSAEPANTDPMVVNWDVSLWGQRRAFTEHVEKLAELLEARTDGKFTLNLSYGGLSPSRENLDGIAEGKFEMAQFCAGYHPEKNPTITVLELPFLGVSSLEQEVEISQAVYAHPATRADLARWNATIVMPSPQPQNNILGSGIPPTSLESFVNMKIRATGGVGRAIDALGAEPINLPAPEVQAALESGDVQAVAFAPHAHMAFNTIESGTWWTTNLNPGTSNCPVVANTDALNDLPDEYRVLLASATSEALSHYVDNYKGATMAAWGPALQERQIIELTINDEILSEINQAVAAPAARTWVSENQANGLPAQELYDLVIDMINDGT